MNPLARSIEELLPIRVSNSVWCFILLRTALVMSSVCAAFLLPVFGKVLKFDLMPNTSSFSYILYLLDSKRYQNIIRKSYASGQKDCLLFKFQII